MFLLEQLSRSKQGNDRPILVLGVTVVFRAIQRQHMQIAQNLLLSETDIVMDFVIQ